MSPLTSSKAFRFLFLFSLLAVFPIITGANPLYHNCTPTSDFTAQSPFQINLDLLFVYLSSNASFFSFYNTTSGAGMDIVYGNFLCIGDTSPEDCQNCVISAVQAIKRLCPRSKEAIAWQEDCQIRYSDQRFFGFMDDMGDITLTSILNISDPSLFIDFRYAVRQLMSNLSKIAAFDSTKYMLATGESNFTRTEKVYGLVQCTRDLSGIDCNSCLRIALNVVLNCCYTYRGARVLSRSCYLRYEFYPLGTPTVRSHHLQPPLSPSTKTSETNHQRSIFITSAAVIAAVFVGIALLGFCLYHFVGMQGVEKGMGNEIANQQTPMHDVGDPTGMKNLDERIPDRDQMQAQEFSSIHFDDILRATNNFSGSNILGQGGFGPVYKGVLSNGKEVAIKKQATNSGQSPDEFLNEVSLIMKLQHQNLVRLLGYCLEKDERILVYEYMPNKSLDLLLDSKRRILLDWKKRVHVIDGIARGILYLHQESQLGIIHRDLKAANVLLDQDLNPKISNFGMAKPFRGNLDVAITNRIVRTYGYMAPEYAMEGLYSIKSDVFSFGVLLLEIITGRKNTGFHRSGLAPSLIVYAWKLWSKGNWLDLMDPTLTESCTAVEFLRYVQIGLLCVQEEATVRPNITSVVAMLRSEYTALPQPQQPAFSVGRFVVQSENH